MKRVKQLLGVFVLVIVSILCVPNSVRAAEMSVEFKSYLNKDGKFEFNSAIPTNDEYFGLMVDTVTYDEQQNWNGLQFNNVADDYSEVDLTINSDEPDEETHRIKLQWNYNEIANQKIKDFIETTLKDKTEFNVYDLELVNYWVNRVKGNYKAELIMFSGELKTMLNYGNIEFDIRTGGGGYAPFVSETIGFAYFGYEGSVYHTISVFGATGNHILYVPTETENTAEAIRVAAQKRIDDYLGETDIEVSYISTAREYLFDNSSITSYNSFEDTFAYELGLAGVSENDLVYSIDIPIDENMGDSKYVIIRRDSSKMVNPISKTADLSTDIEISTDATLPLDTIIQAKELTNGTEYERIIEILNLTDNVTFDLKLYSGSLEKYITKLNDGTFEVKIPVPEGFEGKDLVAYYVKDNGEKEPYTVDTTSEPGYAIFTTNHFSIYTLGYTETAPTGVKVTFDANGGKFETENTYTINDWTADMYDSLSKPTRAGYTFKGYFTEKDGGTKFEMILNEAGIENNSIFYAQWEENSAGGAGIVEPDIENPKTSDEIGTSIFMGIISLIGLVGATIYLKKKNKVREN